MGGFQPKNIIFSDLPKPTEGNFFTALSQGLDGIANVELVREEKNKRDAIEAQNAQVREETLKSTKQQIELNANSLSDAEALKKLGSYESYDAFIKENPIANPHNVKAVQEFYETRTTKMDAESSQAILNTLKANNGGKIPTKAQLSAQLPSLIEDKTLSNKAIGLIYQAVDTQEALELDKAYKQSGITLHNAQAQAALQKEPRATTNPLLKEELTYLELVKSNEIDPKITPFGTWLAQSGGKVTVRSESVTNARNKGREQLSGLANITEEFLANHNPENHGLWDGLTQAIREKTGFHNEKTAQLESDRIGVQTAGAAGMFGGKYTNQQSNMAKEMIGGAFQTEEGTAGKIKSVFNQSILNTEETIRQIENSKGDARDLKEELAKYKKIAKNLEDWDGTEPASKYLDVNYTPKAKGNDPTVRPVAKTIIGTGFDKRAGKKVVKYSDGSVDYAD